MYNFLNEYVKCCKHFSHDTAEYMRLRNNMMYVTGRGESSPYWNETCDNANDGVNLEWAFHLSDEEIETFAPQELLQEVLQDLENSCDWIENEHDIDFLEKIIDKYNNISTKNFAKILFLLIDDIEKGKHTLKSDEGFFQVGCILNRLDGI